MNIEEFANTPIHFNYPKPSSKIIADLAAENEICVIESKANIIAANTYYQNKFPGTKDKIYTRKALLLCLQEIVEFLKPHYGLYIFDAFRTRETQGFLFRSFKEDIQAKHPEMDAATVETETRKFVSHPDEPSRFAVPPHNSGGAIDLALFDLNTKAVLSFGSPFDETEHISSTDFFEDDFDPAFGLNEMEWRDARKNRRILFHTMIHFGFTNYHTEWWHYDLGDCMWAQIFGVDYIFGSMEN